MPVHSELGVHQLSKPLLRVSSLPDLLGSFRASVTQPPSLSLAGVAFLDVRQTVEKQSG